MNRKLYKWEWALLVVLGLLILIVPSLAIFMAYVMTVLRVPSCFWDWAITKTKERSKDNDI